jgi:hypothetical protein
VRDQVPGVGRDAGLLAELRDVRLALLPAHHLVVQVGVGVRAGHRDVAAPELCGQAGEHAHLQVTAGQEPGAALVAQRLLPLLRSEGVNVNGDRDLPAVANVDGGLLDPLAAPVPVGPDELQRLQHPALGGRRPQVQSVHECEQHWPVGLVEPLQQRQVVVAVVRGHSLVRGAQPLQAAPGLKGLQDQYARALRGLLPVAIIGRGSATDRCDAVLRLTAGVVH